MYFYFDNCCVYLNRLIRWNTWCLDSWFNLALIHPFSIWMPVYMKIVKLLFNILSYSSTKKVEDRGDGSLDNTNRIWSQILKCRQKQSGHVIICNSGILDAVRGTSLTSWFARIAETFDIWFKYQDRKYR